MKFTSKKKTGEDFQKVRVWEYSDTWKNPFAEDEDATADDLESYDDLAAAQAPRPRYEKKRGTDGKKKKRRKHRKISAEESSQADSLLSEILSESELEAVGPRMVTVDEDEDGDDCDSMDVLVSSDRAISKYRNDNDRYKHNAMPSSSRAQRERPKPLSPKQVLSSDDEDAIARPTAKPYNNYKLNNNNNDSLHVQVVERGDESSLDDYNPFNGMDDLIKNKPGSSKKSNPFDDESTIQPPPSPQQQKSNPFDDDGSQDDDVATDDDETHIETTLKEDQGVIEIRPVSKDDDDEDADGEEDKDDDDDDDDDQDEDIVESSRRLLRKCDERIQYQHHNDEVQSLKGTIEQMKNQAEAMAEQLRRAVETKCDLVLAQNEMERRHEQVLISKDEELKNMRMYIQEILEAQAKSELNFMNEISSLAKKLDFVEAQRMKDNQEKDYEIAQLEHKMKEMRTTTGSSTRVGFRGSSSSIGSQSTGGGRSRQKVHAV
jgi:hypothetical protein